MNQHSPVLSELLGIVIQLPREHPVSSTPSFRDWLRPGTPESTSGVGRLVLVDTRDRDGRARLASWMRRDRRLELEFDAALVLSGTGAPGNPLRRFIRRVLLPGARRLKPARVERCLPYDRTVTRLGFNDGPIVPATFTIGGEPSTGTAFLITRGPPFKGALWSFIGDHLNDPAFEVVRIDLRVRGAAVIAIRTRDSHYVVRIVPTGLIETLIRRNHVVLAQVRQALDGHHTLLHLIPNPVFADQHGSVALFGETHLGGTLAWKVASGRRADVIHRNTVAYLRAFKNATIQSGRSSFCGIDTLLKPDCQQLERATFVDNQIRRQIQTELRASANALSAGNLSVYASHGDFGYGNILVDEQSGDLTGVIDWDTARMVDWPGIDRVNMEIQIRRAHRGMDFPTAVRSVWHELAAKEAFEAGGGEVAARALFGIAVCRYILRSFSYPALYERQSGGFVRTLEWLDRTDPGRR